MIKKLLNLIFPKICFSCKKTWDYLCKNCKKTLESHPYICPSCSKNQNNFWVCARCRDTKYFDWAIIWFNYKWILKKLLINLKYYHKKDVWEFLAQRLFLVISAEKISENSKIILTYVPSHWIKTLFTRGYNQSEILAKNLAQISWYKFKSIFKKTKYTKSQVWLDRAKRLENQTWSFALSPDIKLDWDETIIIVDDILTTWTTLNQLAKTIKNIYPNIKIWWAIVWRHC